MSGLTVPGNLLLLGEYAVTEQGGLGLALAVERRVVVEMEPASELEVEGRWGEGKGTSPLISAIVETWREQLYSRGICSTGEGATGLGDAREPAARINVDSSAFFTAGRKSGFGSSAAVTVALTCALLHLSGLREDRLLQCAARLALLAHRRAQGGRGSGYDVYASLYGGLGCLVGGAEPSWQAVDLPWLPPLYIFPGPSSVSTPNSLEHYERWKNCDPAGWRNFLEESNHSIRRFLQAEDWVQARKAFAASKELGLRLGERIGVSAALDAPDSLAPQLYKAIAPRNEMGNNMTKSQPQEPGALDAGSPALEPVALSPEGVRWHS
jgi:phosphomevalonate kinase